MFNVFLSLHRKNHSTEYNIILSILTVAGGKRITNEKQFSCFFFYLGKITKNIYRLLGQRTIHFMEINFYISTRTEDYLNFVVLLLR